METGELRSHSENAQGAKALPTVYRGVGQRRPLRGRPSRCPGRPRRRGRLHRRAEACPFSSITKASVSLSAISWANRIHDLVLGLHPPRDDRDEKEHLMPLCVVGSVALDSVETPTETRENVLGGSAVFFSYAASFFTTVRLASVVGEDWPPEHTAMLRARGIDTEGLRVVPGGKTFRWRGKYMRNMNDRETLDLQLNVLRRLRAGPARELPPLEVPLSGQRLARASVENARSVPGSVAGRGRHDGPLHPHRAGRTAATPASGSTDWCSTTARPSC